MKKIFCGLLAVILCFGLCGCEETIPSTINETSESFIGFSAIPGESNLYYDVDTKIVYIIFKERKGYGGYGFMSPYYAPNGFPYQYDANERTLVEIDSSER